MAVKCTNCGGAHPSWDCSKPTKSTAALKEARSLDGYVPKRNGAATSAGSNPAPQIANDVATEAGTQALSVDTPPKPKIGRPSTGFNKKEYNRQFTADLRALRRLGLDCTVKEYRAIKDMENAGHKIQKRED